MSAGGHTERAQWALLSLLAPHVRKTQAVSVEAPEQTTAPPDSSEAPQAALCFRPTGPHGDLCLSVGWRDGGGGVEAYENMKLQTADNSSSTQREALSAQKPFLQPLEGRVATSGHVCVCVLSCVRMFV